MLIRTIRIRIMRTLTFLLTLLMASALQAQPLLDEASPRSSQPSSSWDTGCFAIRPDPS